MWTKCGVVVLAVLGCLVLSLSGCDVPTMAEEATIPGDVTSCVRAQPVAGNAPAMTCSRSVEACVAAGGCWFAGSGLYLYPDGSWRNPDAGAGAWSVARAGAVETVTLGDGSEVTIALSTP